MARLAPDTRYRYGDRDTPARRGHSDQSRLWRRELADAAFPPTLRTQFLMQLAMTPDVVEAAELVGVTHGMVYGRMRRDHHFASQVETVLADHCRGDDWCGTATGYKLGGRCAACRETKRNPPTLRGRQPFLRR